MVQRTKSVKIVCPICGLVWYENSLTEVLAEIEELWKPWQKFMTQQQIQHVRRLNSLERLQEILEKQGYVKCFCLKCQAAATVRIFSGILMDNRRGER